MALNRAKLKTVKVQINLPYIGGVEGTWEPDEREKEAAWEIYVELVTRISVAELKPNEGLLRESLSSLYTLFSTTREILRKHGPAVAKPKERGKLTLGLIAIAYLNTIIRPFLSKWHPILLDYENNRKKTVYDPPNMLLKRSHNDVMYTSSFKKQTAP